MTTPQHILLQSIRDNLAYWLSNEDLAGCANQANLKRLCSLALAASETRRDAIDLVVHNLPHIRMQQEAREWLTLLTRPMEVNGFTEETEVRYLNIRAHLLHLAGGYKEAAAAYQRALKLAEGLGATRLVADACFGLCQVCWSQQQFAEAREFGEKALHMLNGQTEDGARRAAVENALGMVAFTTEQLTTAQAHFQQAAQLYHQAGHPVGYARAINNLAACHARRQEYKQALELYGLAAGILAEEQLHSELCQLEIARGLLHHRLGRQDNALAAFARAAPPAWNNSISPSQRAWAAMVKGYAALIGGEPQLAGACFKQSLLEWQLAGNHKMAQETRHAIARI